MRTVVCGGRDYTDRDLVFATLDVYQPSVVIHGACPTGVDRYADEWAVLNKVPVERYPARWDLYGRSAGPRRNRVMAAKCDMVLAFSGGRGTASMVSEATRLGKTVVQVAKSTI